jgi:hypothetical protein
VKLLADPQVPAQVLVDLVQGERLYPALAALDALALRPPDETVEKLLLAQLNRFHPWNGDGVLRVLESLAPRRAVARRPSADAYGRTVDQHRPLGRAGSGSCGVAQAVAPLTLKDVELPEPDRLGSILNGVLTEQDPVLVEPFRTALTAALQAGSGARVRTASGRGHRAARRGGRPRGHWPVARPQQDAGAGGFIRHRPWTNASNAW